MTSYPPHIDDKYAVSYSTYTNHGCRCQGCSDDRRDKYNTWRRSLPEDKRRRINRRNSAAKERRYREANAALAAPNKGKPWSEQDRRVALDATLTVREAAQRLGRTLYSVRQFRSENRDR